MTPQPQIPLNSVTGIEALILFGLQVFTSVFSLFRKQDNPVPTSASPQIITTLQATPGLSPDHQTIIPVAVNAAVTAHTTTQS